MLKNDTLKNGTSRIGLSGSAPPPPPASIQRAVELFKYFGFNINFCKSIVIPSQKVEYLGVLLDSFNACFLLLRPNARKVCFFFLFQIKLILFLLQRLIGFYYTLIGQDRDQYHIYLVR